MITISILGLDQYVIGNYSKIATDNLATLYDVNEEQIVFYAPESFIFFKGVEQTSWNALVRVHAPRKFKSLQEIVAKYLLDSLSLFIINTRLEFFYYDEEDAYERFNDQYPRFLPEDEYIEEDDEEEHECKHHHGEDCECKHHHDEELYEGNVFEGYQDQLDEVEKRALRELKNLEKKGDKK